MSVAAGTFAAAQAVVQRNVAQASQRALLAQNLVTAADASRGTDRNLSLRLALAALAVSPSAAESAKASLLATETMPRRIGEPISGSQSVISLAMSQDGTLLATGSTNTSVALWNVSDPNHPARVGPLIVGDTGNVNALAISPSGSMLAIGTDDDLVRVWNVSDPVTPVAIGRLPLHTDDIAAVAFSPDERLLASASADGSVGVWSLAGLTLPRLVAQLRPPATGAITSIAFSPIGAHLAAGSYADVINVWPLDRLGDGPEVVTGHGDDVTAVAYAPDGRFLASGSRDGSVRLWEVAEDRTVRKAGVPLTGHVGGVTTLAFAADGQRLLSGGLDLVRRCDVAAPPYRAPPIDR